ncbi:hypothetical protein MPAR162_14480 [Methylorubrum populi]
MTGTPLQAPSRQRDGAAAAGTPGKAAVVEGIGKLELWRGVAHATRRNRWKRRHRDRDPSTAPSKHRKVAF